MSSQRVNIICEETVRHSFVSHLSAALRREGISVSVFAVTDRRELEAYPFPDDHNQGARVSVVIFSESDAFSIPWFKDLERQRNSLHVVVPVLYDVDPLTMNQNLEWLGTLLETGNLTAHQSRNSSHVFRSDSDLVEEIVRDVHGKLFPTERIGIYSRLLDFENLLCEQPWDIRTLGIWGMPGIGKTTLAKTVFDQMSNDYDASCFIENFDETLHKEGIHRLIEENFGNILKERFGVSSSYITRLSLLSDKLCDTRILVVLDDVRNPLVAESFLRRLDWFGPGSLIIITSRYKQVFSFCQFSQVYEVQGLNKHEALQLFSQSAFEKNVPEQKDRELSMKVIDYSSGNPLALRTYGQELKGKKSEMEAAFLELKKCPPQKIQDRLRSVYNALGDNEKYIFLGIACFFKGENVDHVVQLLKGCGYFPHVGIDVLVEKCLVTISENTLQINDLIQDVIQEIIIGERIQMEKCATLWQPSSIRYLLEDDELKENGEPKETPKCFLAEDIEGISLDMSNLIFDVNPDAFKYMVSLRFLKVYNSASESVHGLNFPKGLNFLPCELRLLHWENYPLESLPQGFDLRELVELNMPYSQLKKLRARTKNLEMLTRIRLCHSQQLVKFSIHGYALNIELIDLQGCTRLETFPSMTKLEHLRVLNLSGCKNIKVVPGLPPNIEELHLQGTSIEEIPISIVTHSSQVKPNCKELMNHLKYFPGLEHVDLESVTNLIKASSYIQGFGKLVRLNMKDCFHLQSLPDMVNLESLQVLDLSGCSSLEKIRGLTRNLKELYLAGTALAELPELPQSLELLNAHDCNLLESVRLDFEQLPRHYTFSNCLNLSKETTVEFLEKGLSRVIRLVSDKNQEHVKAPAFNICFPADLRLWSSFQWRIGSLAMVDLAPYTAKALSGFGMSVLVSFHDDCHNTVGLRIRSVCTWKTKTGQFDRIERVFKCWAPGEAPRVETDHVFVLYDAEMHPGGGEGMDQNMSADELKFEFYTVSWDNTLLDSSCVVTACDVKVITDSKGVTSSRASEDISIIEELSPPMPKKPEAMICSPPSSKLHKISTVASKVKSKRNVFSRLVGCVPRVRTIKEDNKKLLPGLSSKFLSRDGSKGSSSTTSFSHMPRTEGEILQNVNLKNFTLSELKSATRNFRPDSMVGEGGFGSVFKGWIDETTFVPSKPGTGIVIAVKRLNQEGLPWHKTSILGHREWLAEINYLGQLDHPNLVKLIGYCLEEEHRLLVYEFMPRGSLENHLFRKGTFFQPLSWNTRIRMALGAARGLAFLHNAQPQVIYSDFKASNILLDSNYNAKLSDFSLARVGPEGDKSHVSTLMGTHGYAAPEYIATGHLSAKSDVYSYGVVLLELLSGRRAIDRNQPVGEQNLVEWAKPYLKNKRRLLKVMDPRLQGHSLTRALKVALLALDCLSFEAKTRPSMNEIVKALEEMYNVQKETTPKEELREYSSNSTQQQCR